MKELSIKEKAKRYDEAIEIARALNSGKGVEAQNGDTVCECIFPEIKENEDERIKHEIIRFLDDIFHFGKNTNFDRWNTADCANWIIWLEKQCEQKSNPYSGVSFEYNGHTWGMCARDGGVDIGYDKQLIANINPIYEKDEFDNLSKAIDNKAMSCNTGDFIMSTAPNHGI